MKFALNKKAEKKAAKNSGNSSGHESPMDVTLLERLVKLMAAHDLNTVDVRDGDKRVILKRGAAADAPVTMMMPAGAGAGASAPHTAPGAAHSASSSSAHAGASEEQGLHQIKSPMVGTFYAAASPDAKPFVSVGAQVDEETDVCVIEAMKVFNNIKAECRGTIARILVTNGQTVEFGQPLFLVKPT
jgi:acetyl-CoA carboxylase biotin carboxyl carrier protein